jgi:hypothetical protein
MKMETVEHFAKIALVTHLLGNEQPLGEKEVQKLQEVRHRYNGGGANVLAAGKRTTSNQPDELDSDPHAKETAESRR